MSREGIARSALECWDEVTAFGSCAGTPIPVQRLTFEDDPKAATAVAALQTLAEVWMFVENDV